uniref:SERRATE/Ars2 C-terminal domain-containing protein n=1 Tax=Plectus sambesii TaxID=2011161 RepID=A0A914UH46_9BILA
MSEAPDDLEPAGLVQSTAYVGSGVFVSQTQNPKPLEEMNLHKVSALFLHNIPPSVTRQELEEMCSQAHGGFLRLHPTEPDPNNKYYRDCVVSYWYNANLKKIMWKLRGTRLRGALLMVMDHREHVRRIENVDGLAADKSVVLRDIQLCKSLIEYLDKKEQLWGHAGPEEVGEADVEISRDKEPPKMNPLLINLDECLAYHLHQLIEGGQEDPTAPKKAESGNKVDRDDNLTRVLDRLILYLRIVHSVDYYGCKVYLTEDEQPRRIGPVSVRGEPSKIANPKRLAKYIKLFEERLKSLFPHQARLAGEHVELLGKRSADSEVEKFIRTNVISVGDGMSKCCLCYKRFTTFEFASLHM